jgi:hypothetical protein
MEEKILFNVLQEIRRGGSGGMAALDPADLKALEARLYRMEYKFASWR